MRNGNEWNDFFEKQLQSLEEHIVAKDQKLDQRMSKLEFDLHQARTVAINAEQLAARLAEDALSGQEEMRRKIQTFDFRLNEMLSNG